MGGRGGGGGGVKVGGEGEGSKNNPAAAVAVAAAAAGTSAAPGADKTTGVGEAAAAEAAAEEPDPLEAYKGDLVRVASKLADSWTEVSFLLRRKIASDADVEEVEAALTAGSHVLRRLDALAKQFGIRRGELVQCLLPFNTNTSASEQGSVAEGQMKKAFEALRDKNPDVDLATFGEEEHKVMVREAVGLRQLARVKLADDADLDMARQATNEAAAFFNLLRSYARKLERTLFSCLAELE